MKSITVRITHLIAVGELFQSQTNKAMAAIIPKDDALPTYKIETDDYRLIEQLSGAVLLVPKNPIDADCSSTIQLTEMEVGYGDSIYPVYSAVTHDKKSGKTRPIFFIAGMVQTIYGSSLFLPTLTVPADEVDIAALVKDPEESATGFEKPQASSLEFIPTDEGAKVVAPEPVVENSESNVEPEEVEFDLIPTTSALLETDATQLNKDAFDAAVENSGYAHLFSLDSYKVYANIQNAEFIQQLTESLRESGDVSAFIYEAFVGLTTDDTSLVWDQEFCANYLAPVLSHLTALAEGQTRVIKVSSQFDCTSFESFCAALRIIKHLSLPFESSLDAPTVEAFLLDTAYVTNEVLGAILNIYVAINEGKTTTAWSKRGKACIVLSLLGFIDVNPETRFTEDGALYAVDLIRTYYTTEDQFEDSGCTNLLRYVPEVIDQLFEALKVRKLVDNRCLSETSIEKRAKIVRAVLNDVITVNALSSCVPDVYEALCKVEKRLSDTGVIVVGDSWLAQLEAALLAADDLDIEFAEYSTKTFPVALSVCSMLHPEIEVTSINSVDSKEQRVKNLIDALLT
jgi:hypothetical protein